MGSDSKDGSYQIAAGHPQTPEGRKGIDLMAVVCDFDILPSQKISSNPPNWGLRHEKEPRSVRCWGERFLPPGLIMLSGMLVPTKPYEFCAMLEVSEESSTLLRTV